MSANERAFRRYWPAGLALFAFVIWLSWPLAIPQVPGGILDHQAAGTAAQVDRIQQAWIAANLYERARTAMIGDLVFIGVYGLGAWYGGLAFMEHSAPKLRRLGMLVIAASALFVLTDYTETIAQFKQLLEQRGSDGLSAIAAAVRPVKIVAWVVTFVGIIAGLAVRRKTPTGG